MTHFQIPLRCPATGAPVVETEGRLQTADGAVGYAVTPSGIPLMVSMELQQDAVIQQQHYDRVAQAYVENLSYPHTIEYLAYLDQVLRSHVGTARLGATLELCCGSGVVPGLLAGQIDSYIGIDISRNMLETARRDFPDRRFTFVQGDATNIPLQDECIDTVIMLGGIHHVNDRSRLFAEIFRILKPGGRFIWREPVSDFLPWRMLRAIIYRLSPHLDAETERPLLYAETAPVLQAVGLDLQSWRTYGFLGFCVFMNSDVLMFNRLFRFIPGIRQITRAACRLDDLVTRLPGMRSRGLIVIGSAVKPGKAAAVAGQPEPVAA